jgi:RNA polymerase sigma-70 factor (ECF subfamily)
MLMQHVEVAEYRLVPAGAIRALPIPAGPITLRHVVSPDEKNERLRRLVDQYIDFVARVLRNAGTPESEVDDDLQRTFITAANRLDDIRIGAEKSFLLQIALRVAAHARRTLARRREVPSDDPPEGMETLATPEQLTDQRQARAMLDRVLGQMDIDLRTVFVLHEFEELNMSEIADVLEIPRGTVASRLRRARQEFRERVIALQGPRKQR